jgi:hypothetical protein
VLALEKYVGDWIVHIRDATSLAHEIHGLVNAGEVKTAENLLPLEVVRPTPNVSLCPPERLEELASL